MSCRAKYKFHEIARNQAGKIRPRYALVPVKFTLTVATPSFMTQTTARSAAVIHSHQPNNLLAVSATFWPW
jgi:hypothetical protein